MALRHAWARNVLKQLTWMNERGAYLERVKQGLWRGETHHTQKRSRTKKWGQNTELVRG